MNTSVNVQIISIGNEILRGATLNTNAFFLSQILEKAGFSIKKHITVADDEKALLSEIEKARQDTHLLCITGGLGPTSDDITRQVIAKFYKTPLRLNNSVLKKLQKQFKNTPLSILKNQATLPKAAKIIPNSLGSASGLIFEQQQQNPILILLPGVPYEIEEMVPKKILPYLKSRFPSLKKKFYKEISFFGLKEEEIDSFLKSLQKRFPLINLGIYPSIGAVSLFLSTPYPKEQKNLLTFYKEITKKFSKNLLPSAYETLEEALLKTLEKKKETLAIAESCTGGYLSHQLTKVPGASKVFIGSMVAYNNSIKQNVLLVPSKILKKHGAVSSQTVRQMATHITKLMQSDWGIAISGIAGPSGGSSKKPVGTIWIAISNKKNPRATLSWKVSLQGTREMIIQQSTKIALCRLFENLK